MLASGAAVIGPAALAVTDRTIIRNEVAAARPSERSMTLSTVGDGLDGGSDFERFAPLILAASGFRQVYATQLTVMIADRPVAAENLLPLQFREDVCAHLTVVAGRCLMGSYEVVVGEHTARRLGLSPGSTLHTDEVNLPEQGGPMTPVGNPRQMMVVGTYRIADPADLYWTQPLELGPNAPGVEDEPVFTTRLTAGYSSSRHQPSPSRPACRPTCSVRTTWTRSSPVWTSSTAPWPAGAAAPRWTSTARSPS